MALESAHPPGIEADPPAFEAGPFVLRPLLHGLPLSADGAGEEVQINCVDYFGGNLYVGTTASELLHFVQMPPDPRDASSSPVFILASRLRPAYSDASTPLNTLRPGVQQILLLPKVAKACVLCNWTATFYSLPELSPVFGTTQVRNCNWIGGVDLNETLSPDDDDDQDAGAGSPRPTAGVTILLSLNRRVQVVRIGEDARVVKKIDFAGSTLSVRRDSIACVADSRSYSLVDVDRQLKIPLMSISSLEDAQNRASVGQTQNLAGGPDGGLLRSASSTTARPLHQSSRDTQLHTRSTSLGGFITGGVRRPISSGRRAGPETDDAIFQDPDASTPAMSPAPMAPDRSHSPALLPPNLDKPLPAPSADAQAAVAALAPSALSAAPHTPSPPKPSRVLLKPHILSPTPDEFLLVTGTGPLEPGIGMFVNLDGDPTRPTLEFETYPHEVVADGGSADPAPSRPTLGPPEDGYVLASMTKQRKKGPRHGLEIQRFDRNPGAGGTERFWLEIPGSNNDSNGQREHDAAAHGTPIGIRALLASEELLFEEVVERLCPNRFSPFSDVGESLAPSPRSIDSRTALSMEQQSKERELFDRDPDSDEEPLTPGWEAKRLQEEKDFARNLPFVSSRVAVWAGANIWRAYRNPLILQLEAELERSNVRYHQPASRTPEERQQLFYTLASIRAREPRTELEFMTFGYVRQKASIMLLASFLDESQTSFSTGETRAMEEVLVDGALDPRAVLSLIPALRDEIIVNKKGIWIHGGVKTTVERYMAALGRSKRPGNHVSYLPPHILQFLRQYLGAWRKKKGLASIEGEAHIFRTVDASLLLVLLELDEKAAEDKPSDAHKPSDVRRELYSVVDQGVECFDRAVDMLEGYCRLFVLSRLYQQRKMAADVLATWRRIIEGGEDRGGGLADGEQRVRTYLSNVNNLALVQEHGIWLALRNPRLGVQVFADEPKNRATHKPRFEPAHVVALLRREAPDAVRFYLEHLVFGKGGVNMAYVDELIGHYLNVVMGELRSSAEARVTFTASYDAYRALRPPKPTFRQFLADNAPPGGDEVWQSRLRLLQLLGGDAEYDAAAIRARIDQALLPILAEGGGPGKKDEHDDDDAADDEAKGRQTVDQQLLVPEAIILDGRAGRHVDALRLLVHRLGDYDTAVSYCLRGGSSLLFSGPAPPGQWAEHQARRDQPGGDRQQQQQQRDEAHAQKRALFNALLGEFLALGDVSDRVEQTGALLDRFGGWFDVLEVLGRVPAHWSVGVCAGFLERHLRGLTRERRQALMARALSAAENLRVNHELLVLLEKGPVVEGGEGGEGGRRPEDGELDEEEDGDEFGPYERGGERKDGGGSGGGGGGDSLLDGWPS